jgi:hypothetical protein
VIVLLGEQQDEDRGVEHEEGGGPEEIGHALREGDDLVGKRTDQLWAMHGLLEEPVQMPVALLQ